jgi:hypothetical protein
MQTRTFTTFSLYIGMIFAILGAAPKADAFFFGPSNYDECIQKRLKPGMSDIQTKAIIGTCRRKFPSEQDTIPTYSVACRNGINFEIEQPAFSSYTISYASAARISQNPLFEKTSIYFSRVARHFDVVKSEWTALKEFKITYTNNTNFDIHNISVGFGQNNESCSEKPIILQCRPDYTSGPLKPYIRANHTSAVICPKPPISKFKYCLNSFSYNENDLGKVYGLLMNTECTVTE